MLRYQLVQSKDGKILSENDSYSFILWASRRYRKLEIDFKIVDSYTKETVEVFEPVIV